MVAANKYRIVRKRVASLKPAPENELLYQEIDPAAPENIALTDDIRQHGLHVPLIVTRDGYIVSGNRRHASLMRLGRVLAPCIDLDLKWRDLSRDERFVLLRSHNQQRDKSAAEQAREAIVDADPAEILQRLHMRQQQALRRCLNDGILPVEIEGRSTRSVISK